jgi:hypothetical protein
LTSIETESAAATHADQTYSGEVEGLRAAADELIKKRGISDASVEGPGNQDDDQPAVDQSKPLSLNQGKKALSDWRKEREAKRAAFEAAVFGQEQSPEEAPPAEGEDGAPSDLAEQYQRARDALTQLEGELGITAPRDQALADAQARLQELETLVSQQQAAQQAPDPIETQLAQHVQSRVAQATNAMLGQVVELFPEARSPQELAQLQRNDPERFRQLVHVCAEADAHIAQAETVAKAEAVNAAAQHQQRWAQWSQAEDFAFSARHPELSANPQAKQALAEATIGYLREQGMDNATIQAC